MKSDREPLKINADFSIQNQITKWIKYMSNKKKTKKQPYQATMTCTRQAQRRVQKPEPILLPVFCGQNLKRFRIPLRADQELLCFVRLPASSTINLFFRLFVFFLYPSQQSQLPNYTQPRHTKSQQHRSRPAILFHDVVYKSGVPFIHNDTKKQTSLWFTLLAVLFIITS